MKIIVCSPGQWYSRRFLKCWTSFLGKCIAENIQVSLCQEYSPNIYIARNKCLGGDLTKGRYQKPFDGASYDYILWIDSDSFFTFEDFKQLLSRNQDIVAGYYQMENGSLAIVKDWDTTSLVKNGTMNFLTQRDIISIEPFPVAYVGMGFMLVKNGVFESFSYPWFRPFNVDIGAVSDFTTEDVFFCLEAQAKGFKVLVDPLVKVGHEKNIII